MRLCNKCKHYSYWSYAGQDLCFHPDIREVSVVNGLSQGIMCVVARQTKCIDACKWEEDPPMPVPEPIVKNPNIIERIFRKK